MVESFREITPEKDLCLEKLCERLLKLNWKPELDIRELVKTSL